MALSGSINTNDYDGRYYTLSWEATQSVTDNTSTVSWTLSTTGGKTWYAERTLKVVVAGKTVVNKTDRVERYAGTVASGTISISHNGDGTASFSVSIEAAVYYSSINCTCSTTFTLNTIPRASTISVNTLTLGTAGIITISPANSNFTHTLSYLWGDTTESGLNNGKGYKGTIATQTSETEVSWAPSKDLANVIPNALSGVGSLICDTYSGSTKVGSSNITFTAKVPDDIIPSIDSASISIDNSDNSVVSDWGLYVLGYSKAQITASATGSYKSTISSFTISGGYSATKSGSSLNYTGIELTSSGEKSFSVIAKDSRGRNSASKNAGSIMVYAYSKPTMSYFSVSRSSNDPTKIVAKANWSYASVNGKNSTTATLKYKKTTETSWSTYGTISKNASTTLSTTFEETSSYNFQVIVTDSLSNSASAETKVSTVKVLLDFRAGGKGLGIGKIAETDALEVGMSSKFSSDIYLANDCSIHSYDKSNTEMNVFKGVSAAGNTLIGYGQYTNGSGNTHIYGNDVLIYSAASGVESGLRPYYRKGDTITMSQDMPTTGYITNSGKTIYFIVPLTKPVLGNPTVTASSDKGFIVRQNEKYLYGGTSYSDYVIPSSYSAYLSPYGIRIAATFDVSTNAINNSPCGIDWSGIITFS